MPPKFKLIKAPKKADLLSNYINSLDERNKIAYEIAKDHLGTSFDLEKSIRKSGGHNTCALPKACVLWLKDKIPFFRQE